MKRIGGKRRGRRERRDKLLNWSMLTWIGIMVCTRKIYMEEAKKKCN
jgi:hypothetical protein